MDSTNDSMIKDKSNVAKMLFKSFLSFLKRDWGRILIATITFIAVSVVVYFSANTSDSIVSYSVNDYEVGQIADKTILATKTMSATESYPIALEEGEKIIKKGFPITEEGILKLKKMADAPSSMNYRNVGNIIFYLILVVALWIVFFSPVILGKRVEIKEVILECVLFFITFFFTSFAQKSFVFQSAYKITVAIPSVLCVFLVAILFGQKSAFMFGCVLSAGVLGATNFQIVPAMFTLATSLSSARIVRKIEKRTDLVFASTLQASLNIVFIIIMKVIFNADMSDAAFVILGVAFNGFISGIFVLGLLTPLESILNTASVFRLMDLINTNTPTLQRMLKYAGGTHSHSMMVAQLAEDACKKIGANYLLARVASYYHDIGKIDQPEYFTENQIDGVNKHDTLNPSISASIIRSHVKKGVEEAKKLHLPPQVIDIIAEHHGNSVITWFFNKAKELDPNVSEVEYSYQGNPPVTRESAVVMLADTVEAACRSLENPTFPRLEKFIQTLIDAKISGLQLENSGLTFGELSIIKKSFVDLLAPHYRGRIKYPNQKDPDEVSDKESKSENQNETQEEK